MNQPQSHDVFPHAGTHESWDEWQHLPEASHAMGAEHELAKAAD
jgi:hypothetical protein